MFRTLLIPTAILALALSTTAHASTYSQDSIAVTYGDLNLSSPQDASILAARLQSAANLVCLNANDTKAPVRKILVRKCVDMAVTKATAHIFAELEASPHKAVRANLVSVRQTVASADIPLN